MESQKIYLGNAGGSDINTLLASALSSKGLDPNVVMAQLGNRNGGFFGGNGIDSLIALVVIFALIGSFNGNGNGFFGGNFRGKCLITKEDFYLEQYENYWLGGY